MRLALGVSYRGQGYQGWQSQPGGNTVQDRLEAALGSFADRPVTTICAGRTDAGVHGLNQVVHLDVDVHREPYSGCVAPIATSRRHRAAMVPPRRGRLPCPQQRTRAPLRYLMLESPCGLPSNRGRGLVLSPACRRGHAGAAALLVGEHDFSAFRSSECQAATPVKTLRGIEIHRRGAYWRFEFDASAFLHHMVRNIMGCLVAVGSGTREPQWLGAVLASRDRAQAAPTFPPDGPVLRRPYYDARHAIPAQTPAMDWLP
jgi:tRNA pseudouridine38-40 synthase